MPHVLATPLKNFFAFSSWIFFDFFCDSDENVVRLRQGFTGCYRVLASFFLFYFFLYISSLGCCPPGADVIIAPFMAGNRMKAVAIMTAKE